MLHAGFSCSKQGLLCVVVQQAGATLCCGAWASHCGGFSCCGARALGMRALVVAAHGLSSCGSRALECKLSSVAHGLSCSAACGIFLDQGSNTSLALAGGFTTALPTDMPSAEFMINVSIQNDYSLSCPTPVLLKIEEYQRKGGIETE